MVVNKKETVFLDCDDLEVWDSFISLISTMQAEFSDDNILNILATIENDIDDLSRFVEY